MTPQLSRTLVWRLFPVIDPTIYQWSREARTVRWLTLVWLAIGLVTLFSASYPIALAETGIGWRFLAIQLLWAFIGLSLFNWIVCQPLAKLVRLSGLLFFGLLGLLFLTLMPALGITINGATRWLAIGPFLIQPSELLKPLLILQAARLFGRWSQLSWSTRGLWVTLFAVAIAFILLQPNLSTAAICGLSLWLIALAAGLPYRLLLTTAATGLLTAVISLGANTYQRERVTAFLNPWADPMGNGYQLIQSLLAIGSGGLFGSGFGFSEQKLFYLPIQYTDFIFAVYAEEFGFAGSAVLLLLLLAYASLATIIAIRATHPLHRLTAVGVMVLLVGQSFLNIGVAVGALPTTGLPLPLFSYGGSSMISSLVSAALLTRVAREIKDDNVVQLPTQKSRLPG
ncbi:FtsW/RodA/SpoVE family cell cycle protein [Oscillatoria sp. CS-180]|uniref:FtsW/RodA/SpoVE family cell cycle protein n=1 Tax=Oscillatoria sp. CS-180 TaxID=3021720 RepID=UPI0023315506|nr:FtsW/RodA/SpoVE family cell cycle protein [Oscillatoria sp. CS-180]MDB9526912.1 FtsW/RodA/SpoVE family cell cycle protein [Oscillatoria sp. CS-180]